MSVSVDTPDLIIEELAGPKRRLRLNGRALPLKEGGLLFGVQQRVSTQFPAGNPVASRSVFGSTLPDTSINGKWSDRWIGDGTYGDGHVQPQAIAELNGFQIASLADLDALLESICACGIELRLSWAHKVRTGTMKKYEGTWRTIHDLEWKMEFEWMSRGEPKSPVTIIVGTAFDNIVEWQAKKAALVAASSPGLLAILQETMQAVSTAILTLTTAIDSYIETAGQYITGITSPVEIAIALSSALVSIRDAAATLLHTITLQIDRAITPFSEDPFSTTGRDVGTADWQRILRLTARDTRDSAAQEQRDIARKADQRLRDIYIACQGDDLRHVSTVEYGTPNEWQRLRAFNGLTSSGLLTGQVVLVPEIAAP